MTDILNGGNFDFLKEDAAQRSNLGVNSDLSFTIRKGSIASKLRADLTVIAHIIDDTLTAMFNSCTRAQLDQIASDFKPELALPDGTYFRMDNLAQGPDQKWCACNEGIAHDLYDLDIYQLLDLMAVAESVLYTVQNKER